MIAVDADYCPCCGTDLDSRHVDDRKRRYCPTCDRIIWRNAVPGTQVAVCDAEGVLLVQRRKEPAAGRWALPGGHMEAEESPERAAVRELAEETGVRVVTGSLEMVATNHGLLDGERYSVTFGFAAAREDAAGDVVAGTDATAAQVVEWDEVRKLDCWDYSAPIIDAARETVLGEEAD